MTRGSTREYLERMRVRYMAAATRKSKTRMLDEICEVTGYHRKAVVRLINRKESTEKGEKRGRPKVYDGAVILALKKAWESCGAICARRLVPFLPMLVPRLESVGELRLTSDVRDKLLGMSISTAERLLQAYRWIKQPRRKGGSTGTTSIRNKVPIRTFGEWKNSPPGECQADLVTHCGESGAGFFLCTLSMVDVRTGWTELQPVWGKGQQRVGTAVHLARNAMPFPVIGLHTDNGSEFLNSLLYGWCEKKGIRFTRGRPYRKNDQAYVEQKNWSCVRKVIGYDRYANRDSLECMRELYQLSSDFNNYFHPVRKLLSKEREGSKVRKRFDQPQTPYQRVLSMSGLDTAAKVALQRHFETLNPVKLLSRIEAVRERLWTLRDRTQEME